MGEQRSTCEELRNSHKILVLTSQRELKGKRLKRSRMENIKIYLKRDKNELN
jgi:hypothetical protein